MSSKMKLLQCCPVRTPQRARTPVCNAVRVGVFMEMESVAQSPIATPAPAAAAGAVTEAVMKSNLVSKKKQKLLLVLN